MEKLVSKTNLKVDVPQIKYSLKLLDLSRVRNQCSFENLFHLPNVPPSVITKLYFICDMLRTALPV